MRIDTNTLSPLEAALEYAHLGMSVLPLHTPQADGTCSCGKVDCHSIGKHPRVYGGVKDASTDIDVIKAWWKRWPNANVGIATGVTADIGVLDIDPRHKGHISLNQLEEEYSKLPETLRVRTGSGGEHIFFKYPGESIINSAGKIREGIDFKTQGGYVVAAPSVHASGNKYQWTISEGDIAEIPDWLRTLLIENKKKTLSTVISGDGVIPDGQRNITLYGLACSLRSKGFHEDEILAPLQVINKNRCNPPLDDSEIIRIVTSAGIFEPGNLVVTSDKTFNNTDVGNAKRLVARFGHMFRYCSTWKKFLVWDSKRFVIDDTGEIERLAKATVKSIYVETAALADEGDRKRQAKHAMNSENQQRIKAMVALAQTEQGIPVRTDELDNDEWLLNCQNGTINLRTGELQPHSPSHLITKLVPVEYDLDVQCPTWMAFLQKVMGGNEELIRFLQKAIGYSLTGSTREQCMFILHGSGANGKSTFLNTLETMFADYAQQTPTDTLMAKKNEGIRNDVARLKGARFVIASEAEQGKALAESLIKQMTGGDKLTARFLHSEYFEFVPKFKLFLATNHKPNIRGTDNGIWRRIRLIPFAVTIPEDERDFNLPNKLKAELPGIFHWAVQGCLAWQREGLAAPREVSQATDEYRGEMDWLQSFIDEKFTVRSGLKVAASLLYIEYQAWCKENGEREYSQRILGMRLKDKGFQTRRSGQGGSTEWVGLAPVPVLGFTEVTEPTEAELDILQLN